MISLHLLPRSVTIVTVLLTGVSGLATAAVAAAPAPLTNTASPENTQPSAQPAEKCMADVRAFSGQMRTDGYWVGSSDYGYGYPMGGYGYGYSTSMGGGLGGNAGGYTTARSGYEVHALVAAANILAQSGQEQPCENVLAATRKIYAQYRADLTARGVQSADLPGWQKRQISAAEPVMGDNVAFGSDQLVDTNVVDPSGNSLGTVHDLVTSPQTGKIAYVVIARGGLFGIDASYTPIPWADFKSPKNASLLVLDTTKAIVEAAPQGSGNQFTKVGDFNAESQKVNAYWTPLVKPAVATN